MHHAAKDIICQDLILRIIGEDCRCWSEGPIIIDRWRWAMSLLIMGEGVVSTLEG